VRPATARGYRYSLEAHAVPILGRLPLAKIRSAHVQQVVAAVSRGGRSSTTARNAYRVLSEALKDAVRWGLLTGNPAAAVRPPRPADFRAPVLTVADLEALMNAADEEGIGALVRVAVMTGLRQGEILRLRWEDIDLGAGTLMVRASKSRAGLRSLALSPQTVTLLRAHRACQLEARLRVGEAYADPGLVFATSLGTPEGNLRRAWGRVVRRTGVRVRFHDLRHGHATLLLRQGVHPKVVQERLGHSRVEVTLNIYSHVLPNMQAEAARALDGLFSSARGHNRATSGR
jgi:integrase